MCVTCIDSVYVFNHRAILAEWFKGIDSKNDALVFGKLIHAGRCPAQTNITSHCVHCSVCVLLELVIVFGALHELDLAEKHQQGSN